MALKKTKKIKKILHIDDEPFEVNGIAQALEKKDFKVQPFAWPEDAEDPEEEGSFTNLPEFGEYDLVLLDVIMGPGDLGRERTDRGFTTGIVFHKEKMAKKYPKLPVFFISALSDGRYKTKTRKYAEKHGIPYIKKSGETVGQIVRHIRKLESAANDAGEEAS